MDSAKCMSTLHGKWKINLHYPQVAAHTMYVTKYYLLIVDSIIQEAFVYFN